MKALADRGYTEPMPVQAAVLQAETTGRDLLVSAQTGSGKTIAYGLLLAEQLLGDNPKFPKVDKPLALVVAPTRELALQVQRELIWLFAATTARVVSCVGGMDIRQEIWQLSHGAHIVVGTPGRLCDHLDHGNLVLSGIQTLVLDEGDEMLDMGFRDELERLVEATPAERRTLLFSATLPKEIEALAGRYQKNAFRISEASGDEPHGDIAYKAILTVPREREHAVVNVLRHLDASGALVFCTTREGVRRLHSYLLERGFAVVALSGEMGQGDRNRALQSLRDGRSRVCVATDVAARGLDLPDLGLVIHADMPRDAITLLHRSGRTGRAGRKGVAVVLVPVNLRREAERLLRNAKVDPTWSPPPSADSIRAADQDRIIQRIIAEVEQPSEDDLTAARVLLQDLSPEELVAVLVRQQRVRLPAPEEVTESLAIRAEVRPPRPRFDREHEQQNDRDRPSHELGDEAGWFKVNVGRSQNADPRWIVPMLCRRGRITRNEIGRIIITPKVTFFQIAPYAREGFAWAAGRPDRQEPGIRIQEADSKPPGPSFRK